MRQHTKRAIAAVDRANIGLILASATIAYFIPFWLFLFSYAVLGPLHYLTEIDWLRQKGFFVARVFDRSLLIALGIGLFLLSFTAIDNRLFSQLMLTVFFSTAVMVMPKRDGWFWVLVGCAIFFLCAPITLPTWVILFGFFLPTLLHVYVFTGLFMYLGAIKSQSIPGLIAVATFIIAPILLVTLSLLRPEVGGSTSKYVHDAYHAFLPMHMEIVSWFTTPIGSTMDMVYNSPIGVTVMKFIAFAYTYHYLNWFSKTRIIHWNETSKRARVIIMIVWVASVALYAIDYRLGFVALYLLSLIHVVLEFPLNHRAIAGGFVETRIALARFLTKES